jgi:surface antigen
MIRRVCLVAALSGLIVGDPASAQFGSFLKSLPSSSSSASTPTTSGSGGCANGKKSRGAGAAMMGKMLGNVADRTVGRSAIAQYIPIPEVAGLLTDAIACKLDAGEQKQAAAATTTALRSGEVGSSSSWTSETHPEVSGTSTVTARTKTADGSTCMAVNDVIIVNGEETTVQKKMCRAPGSNGYTLAA